MYSFAIAGNGSSDALWAWFTALRELAAASSALDDAAVALQGLAAETDWQAEGVRALHLLLDELRIRAQAEAGAVREREAQVGRLA